MAGVSGSQRVTFIVLRFMRVPILVLIVVYAAAMIGWVMIPGPDHEDGNPLSLFHAFYFLTYTATTTGFGEIPYAFTETQRLWSTVCLYAGVIAWLYAIGAIVRLIQNPHFQHAVSERRFAAKVARLPGEFVILCGFGNTGSLLTRGLNDAGIDTVILDNDPDRIHAVFLRDYTINTPALAANARIPNRLIEAGLTRPNCGAVLALTDDEEVNVKIAVAARLLNPKAKVVVNVRHDTYGEILATLGPDVRVVDAFQTYARYLAATIHNPLVHMLSEWLAGAPDSSLAMYPEVPRGRWILCGYGRMGHAVREVLSELKIPTVVIDPGIEPEAARATDLFRGRASQKNLKRAGIEHAVGIVAGTDGDPENLSIVINARALNPDVFVVVRQNLHRNQVLFNAALADLIMQPNLVSARRILYILTAPLLRAFFQHVRIHALDEAGDAGLRAIVDCLRQRVGGTRPKLWTALLTAQDACALSERLERGEDIRLGDILRDPAAREDTLRCACLVIRSGDDVKVMPGDGHRLAPGDELLMCGRIEAARLFDATLNNPYTLDFLLTGVEAPRGYVMRWLAGTRPPPATACETGGGG
jgi:Trk K+ transport system NAD-binding subunit